jgi:deoxyribodipyrimidine photo-lyase
MRTVWWIKRDFRLADNAALTEACRRVRRDGGEVLPVYAFEPSLLQAPETGALHVHVILTALQALREALRGRGAELLVLHGEVPAVFEKLLKNQAGDDKAIAAILAEEETGTRVTFQRDTQMRRWAEGRGIPFREFPHNGVIRGLTDRDQRMPLWRARMKAPAEPAPTTIPMSAQTRRWCAATAIPEASDLGFPQPEGAVQRVDEQASRIVLDSFLSIRGREYSKGISSPEPARYSGSRLSPHLAWGTITLRQVLHRLEERVAQIRRVREESSERAAALRGWLGPLNAFRSRLYWHDHFCQRLETEPDIEFRPLNRVYEDLPYDAGTDLEECLWAGRTGFPMVDATVRSLSTTGFCNFRMRAMLVSFATYALHIDWRRLRDPMARIMADYLPGIHLSQLQMQASVVGINTVRVYNPTKQLLDNDPSCRFVRRFVPELRDVPPEAIIAHAVQGVDSPSHGLQGRATDAAEAWTDDSGGLGDYPPPVVDFRSAVKTMRGEIYRRKRSAAGKQEAERVLNKHGSRRRRGRS